jgi:hypothetical protein
MPGAYILTKWLTNLIAKLRRRLQNLLMEQQEMGLPGFLQTPLLDSTATL